MLADSATVSRRPAERSDDDLLRALFAQSRPDLAMLPEDARAAMLDLQYRAQRQQYDLSYPDATHDVLVADGIDVGRLILDRDGRSVRIVEVTISEARRGHGIGSSVLREVIASADRDHLTVTLSVWSANAGARRLYERLGFAVVDDESGYLEMARHPTSEGD